MDNYKLVSPRDFIGETLIEFAEENEKIAVIDSDLSSSVTTNKFAEKFPERFFEMGIAEQNSMGVTTGLAIEGLIPFFVDFSIFVTGTVWTQLRQACYSKANVKIIGSHPGIDNGPDGATHHALEDIALSRVLPNLTVLIPADTYELKDMIKKAIEINGPVYIRTARDVVPLYNTEDTGFEPGKAQVIYDEGDDIALIFEGTAGKQAFEGFELLKENGYKCKLINIRSIKPVDKELILKTGRTVKGIITVENHSVYGGLGSVTAEILGTAEHKAVLRYVGIKDTFTESGKTSDVKEKYGLSKEKILIAAEDIMKK